MSTGTVLQAAGRLGVDPRSAAVTYLLADGTSGSISIQCFSEGEGSDSFHFSFGYGVSDLRHETSGDGKALIGFNDGGKVSCCSGVVVTYEC